MARFDRNVWKDRQRRQRRQPDLGVLFPDGLSFLKLPYNQEWGQSQKRITQVETEALEPSINEIAGPEFLEQVRRTHEVYGQVLGITKASPLAQIPVRQEKLRLLRKAMNRYVFNVLGMLGDDEESIELVRQALQPVDELRASVNARRDQGEDEVEVIEETPVASPAPVASVAPIASVTPANGPINPAPVAISVPAPNGTPS